MRVALIVVAVLCFAVALLMFAFTLSGVHWGSLAGAGQPEEGTADGQQAPTVLLLEQVPHSKEGGENQPRVRYGKTPDGRVVARMDIDLHIQKGQMGQMEYTLHRNVQAAE